MNYIDCSANTALNKVNQKWQNDNVQFWKDDELLWSFRDKNGWQYGYTSLKEAVIRYTSSLANVSDPSIKTTGSLLIDKDYEQSNAWNKNEKGKKVSSINCNVIVRRFL